MMANTSEKVILIFAGNLNFGRSYLITTVPMPIKIITTLKTGKNLVSRTMQ
jgi:hypothetical protein